MNKKNHGKITMEALEMAGCDLHPNAQRLIKNANIDSDHQSGPAQNSKQHYCGPAPAGQVIAKNKDLIARSLDAAAVLVRRNNEQEMMLALYFLGRAFHCTQDFYAHSNWIALGNLVAWDGITRPPRLKFCGETGKPFWENDNFIYKSQRLLGIKTLGKLEKPKKRSTKLEEAYKLIKKGRFSSEQDVRHPEMHLDCKDSWADKAISKNVECGGGGAFQKAFELAAIDTAVKWFDFRGMVMQTIYDPEITRRRFQKEFMWHMPSTHKRLYKDEYNPEGRNAMSAWENFANFNPGRGKNTTRKNIEHGRAVFANYMKEFANQNALAKLSRIVDPVFGYDAAIG